MKEKLAKLLSVKSIVTIILTLAFVYQVIVGDITNEQLYSVFLMVIGFYFGTQHEKKVAKDV